MSSDSYGVKCARTPAPLIAVSEFRLMKVFQSTTHTSACNQRLRKQRQKKLFMHILVKDKHWLEGSVSNQNQGMQREKKIIE